VRTQHSYEDTLIGLLRLGEALSTSNNPNTSAAGRLVQFVISDRHPEITIKAHEQNFED
jgi:hypothetical protein